MGNCAITAQPCPQAVCPPWSYAFLVEDDYRHDDPSHHLDAPKLGRTLPKSLSEHDMGLLIKTAWDDRTSDGLALLAMLELLYGAGLRVSELINLQVSLFARPRDHITITGKGDKDRVVVLTQAAQEAITAWILSRDANPQNGALILSFSIPQIRQAAIAARCLQSSSGSGAMCWADKIYQPSHAASFFCNAYA